MKRGEAARRLINEGEDPFTTLLTAVWSDHDWSESALYARLTSCAVGSEAVHPVGHTASMLLSYGWLARIEWASAPSAIVEETKLMTSSPLIVSSPM